MDMAGTNERESYGVKSPQFLILGNATLIKESYGADTAEGRKVPQDRYYAQLNLSINARRGDGSEKVNVRVPITKAEYDSLQDKFSASQGERVRIEVQGALELAALPVCIN